MTDFKRENRIHTYLIPKTNDPIALREEIDRLMDLLFVIATERCIRVIDPDFFAECADTLHDDGFCGHKCAVIVARRAHVYPVAKANEMKTAVVVTNRYQDSGPTPILRVCARVGKMACFVDDDPDRRPEFLVDFDMSQILRNGKPIGVPMTMKEAGWFCADFGIWYSS